jgi:hypothetical protein
MASSVKFAEPDVSAQFGDENLHGLLERAGEPANGSPPPAGLAPPHARRTPLTPAPPRCLLSRQEGQGG